MEVRPWEEDDLVPGVPFKPAYLRHARASGAYVGLVVVHDGRIYGAIEGGMLLHTMRGPTMRTRSIHGIDQAMRPLVEGLRAEAVRRGCRVMYLASAPGAPKLCTAAMSLKFTKITDNFVMHRPNIPVLALVPGVRVRPMRAEEFAGVRDRLLPLVSEGPYVATEEEIQRFQDSRLFFPYVAEVEGKTVAYAELDLFHSVFASSFVGRIERVVVDEAYRDRRVGSALVGELLRQSVRHGCEKTELHVRDSNALAIRLYTKLGFVRKEEIPYYLAL